MAATQSEKTSPRIAITPPKEQVTPGTTLAGRSEELLQIDRLLRSAAEGFGQSLIFQGGAGTGKTVILQEAIATARAAGFRVMLARGSHAEHNVPLSLARRLVDSVLTSLPEARQQPLLQILTDLPDDPFERSETAADHRRRTFYLALRHLLRNGTASPILVVVDNLHWADRASLEWLVTLPEHIASLPVALLGSVCDGVPGTDADLVDETLVLSSNWVTLRNLNAGPVTAMAERRLGYAPDQSLVTTLMRITDGNPQLLTAMLKKLVDEGVPPDATEGGLDTVVVDELARSVEVRLRRVSPHALAVLRAVATLDEQATLPRLSTIAGIGPSTAQEVVRRLRRLGYLGAGEGGNPRVRPVLVRNAVLAEDAYGALGVVRTQAARLLRNEPGAEDSVCRHLMQSTPIGEAWVPELLRSAAHAAVTSADPHTAVLYLRRALAEPLPDPVRAQVLLETAIAAGHVDLPTAAAYLSEAMTLIEPADRPGRVPLDLIDVLILGGREDEIGRMDGEESGRHGQAITSRRAVLPGLTATTAQQLPRIRQPEEEALTSALEAAWKADRGEDLIAAVAKAERVLKMSVTGPEDIVARLLACRVLIVADLAESAGIQCDDAVLVARRWGHRFLEGSALACRAAILYASGNLRAAEVAAVASSDVLSSCRASPQSVVVLDLRATHVDILVDLGRRQEAADLLEQLEPIEDQPSSRPAARLLAARGRLRARGGQHIGGLRDLNAAGGWLAVSGIVNPAVTGWRAEVVLALHQLGDATTARAQVDIEMAAAQIWGTPAATGRALRLLALVAPGQRVRGLLERSVHLLSTSGERLSLAESLTDLGTHLVLQGDKPSARELLRQAYTIADEAACTDLVGRSRAQLAASGGRPRRSAKAGLDGLTESERKVAELAATRKTNKAIAALLFVGQRTVEIHLTNVYRKLGIEGRDQLRAALGRPADLRLPDPGPGRLLRSAG